MNCDSLLPECPDRPSYWLEDMSDPFDCSGSFLPNLLHDTDSSDPIFYRRFVLDTSKRNYWNFRDGHLIAHLNMLDGDFA